MSQATVKQADGVNSSANGNRIRLHNVIPILSVHALCLGVIWVGWSPVAVAVATLLFFVRMFFITAFYHRYFSHRTFQAHRITQFFFALAGLTAAQRGPSWWAAHHRSHHRHSDKDPDLHSPSLRGLLWSHVGWFISDDGDRVNWDAVPDWAKYPELRWLERNHRIGAFSMILLMGLTGWTLSAFWPQLQTSPMQMIVWGFAISTTALYHSTFTINSLSHTFGSQRFRTGDDSRNNWLLALLTLGEGWHNNHHYYPGTDRQGFYWWEIDITYYILRLMQATGLIWGLRPVPPRVYSAALAHKHETPAHAEHGE